MALHRKNCTGNKTRLTLDTLTKPEDLVIHLELGVDYLTRFGHKSKVKICCGVMT